MSASTPRRRAATPRFWAAWPERRDRPVAACETAPPRTVCPPRHGHPRNSHPGRHAGPRPQTSKPRDAGPRDIPHAEIAARSRILDAVRYDHRALIAPTGLQMSGWSEIGTGQPDVDKPFLTPDTVDDLRISVAANPISNLYWDRLGAYPTLTPATEAASNISTGLIDVYPTIPAFWAFQV